jgi:hypothetical protein
MRERLFLLLFLAGLAGCSTLDSAQPAPGQAKRNSAAISMDAGNLSRVHPLEKPKPHVEQLGASVSQETKDHTYLFFINGLDPYYLANFRGQCQYMKTLGYNNAYCGQMSHTDLFRQMIKQIRKDDPRAQVVVIGYSTGANCARTLANHLKDDGVAIDLLVYLGGDTIKDGERSRPENVGRIVNVCGHGMILLGYDLFVRGDEIKGASNHRLNARHFLLPTRAEAAELLVRSVVDLNQAPLSQREDAPVSQASWNARVLVSRK